MIGNVFKCFYLRWGDLQKLLQFLYKDFVVVLFMNVKNYLYNYSGYYFFMLYKYCYRCGLDDK